MLFIAALYLPSTATASTTITSVTFSGNAADPHITITGHGFGSIPNPTNLGYPGYSGYDYGNALYICDKSNSPNSFCAGQNDGSGSGDTIGLVVGFFSDTQISYTLGSTYSQAYYPSNIYQLQPGDNFAVYVPGAICTGRVTFDATVPCQGPSTPSLVSVTLSGDAADPQVTIAGQGFSSPPPPTNLAYPGYTGYDYGNTLYFCDLSQNPNVFCAGQNDGSGGWDYIGLVIGTYTDTQISYSLGSAYSQYYYPTTYQVHQGDTFAVFLKGAACTGRVDFSGTPVQCRTLPPANPPSSIISKILPAVRGEAIQRQVMTVKRGRWVGSPSIIVDQWERCDLSGSTCIAIRGATRSTYRPVAADVGRTIRVQETAGNPGSVGAPALSPPTSPVLPLLVRNDRLRRQIDRASVRLLHRRAVDVRLSVRLTGGLARSLAMRSGTTLTGRGTVAFTNHRARWSLALPHSVGGGKLQVITIGSAAYVRLGAVTSFAGRHWVGVRAAQLREVPRLGFAGSLAVLLNPEGTLELLRASTSHVAQVTPATSGGAPAGSGRFCTHTTGAEAVEAGLTLNRLTGLTKAQAATYREILSALSTPRVVAEFDASGALTRAQLIDQNGLTITTDYCPRARGARGTIRHPSSVTRLPSTINVDPCLVGRWRLAGPGKGTVQLTISRTGSATLSYRVRTKRRVGDYGLADPVGGQNAIGVFGSAKATVLAPESSASRRRQLVWGIQANHVHQIIAGNYFPGGGSRLPLVVYPWTVPVSLNGTVQATYTCKRGGTLILLAPIGTKSELGLLPDSWHRG